MNTRWYDCFADIVRALQPIMIRFFYWDYKETRTFACVIYTENDVGIAEVNLENFVIIPTSEVTIWFYVTYSIVVLFIVCILCRTGWKVIGAVIQPTDKQMTK